MAKKTREHKIDDAAKRVLPEILDAHSWHVEMHPDYGIDFRVQMLQGDTVSWQVFLAQLKGHDGLHRTEVNGQLHIKQAIRTDRLRDYFEVYREPVFVVLVDTSTKAARYLFVQPYAQNPLLPPAWRAQTKVTLYIPDGNDFRDQDRFRKDLDLALKHMNEMYP